MSSRRSRSAGTVMRITSSRYIRSSRNRPGGDLLSQVAIRRGDEPDVDASRDVLADTAHFAFLERAQHLGLRARRQLADFVEEERPEMRFLEHPGAFGEGAGERAAAVAEELRVDEIVGKRRTVDCGKRPVAAETAAVKGACDQLLARPALAFHEHR